MSLPEIVETWNGPGRTDGRLTEVHPRHNAAHPVPGSRTAFEHWYFDAHLDDGRTIIGFLTLRRPEEPALVSKPSVEMLVYSPDGTRRQVMTRYSKKEASASIVQCEVNVGRNHAHAEFPEGGLPIHHLYMSEEGMTFDLRFHNELPSWMPGEGETFFGKTEVFGWVVGSPRARVEGSITVDGKTTEVTGRGYADHNWGAGDMKRVIDRWHWGRLYDDDYSLLYALVKTQKRLGRHESRPLMLAYRGEVILSSGEAEVTEGPMQHNEIANRSYPEWLRIEVPGKVTLLLTVKEIVHAHDLLDDIPVAGHKMFRSTLYRVVGHPGYFRFHSTFELTVVRDGVTETRTGDTLHELVALN
ncbi:MAG: lipocalin-like domain-containing protein [Rhodococcus sp. (in: high G+C Gram-positive bacteria)]